MGAVPIRCHRSRRIITVVCQYFQPIIVAAKARDVGESDTVTIVKDMLADVFGYDKYAEVISP